MASPRKPQDPRPDDESPLLGLRRTTLVENLRADYVLPSRGLPLRDAGVFWPL